MASERETWPKGFADLADLPEDKRIEIVAATAKAGNVVGVVIDDIETKVKRYIRKIEAHGVRVIERRKGPVKGTVLVRVGPMEE